jgi:hypothetical protein
MASDSQDISNGADVDMASDTPLEVPTAALASGQAPKRLPFSAIEVEVVPDPSAKSRPAGFRNIRKRRFNPNQLPESSLNLSTNRAQTALNMLFPCCNNLEQQQQLLLSYVRRGLGNLGFEAIVTEQHKVLKGVNRQHFHSEGLSFNCLMMSFNNLLQQHIISDWMLEQQVSMISLNQAEYQKRNILRKNYPTFRVFSLETLEKAIEMHFPNRFSIKNVSRWPQTDVLTPRVGFYLVEGDACTPEEFDEFVTASLQNLPYHRPRRVEGCRILNHCVAVVIDANPAKSVIHDSFDSQPLLYSPGSLRMYLQSITRIRQVTFHPRFASLQDAANSCSGVCAIASCV